MMNPLLQMPYTLDAVLTILLVVVSVNGEDGCKVLDFLDCQKNKTLTGHVIKSFRFLAPGSLDDCQHKCFLEDKCVSYNLGPVEGLMRSCELNDVDHVMWSHDYVTEKEDFEYCPIKNRCSSRPCPPSKICVPDFFWDSFSCIDGVWTPWTSWTACRDLPDCPRTRARNCSNPTTPQNIGTNCNGLALESDNTPCPPIPTVDITGCKDPLGMEDRTILDSQITASSILTYPSTYYNAKEARLNNAWVGGVTTGAWTPAVSRAGEYLQVDLGGVKKVTKIATQGRTNNNYGAQWVTEYSLSYSNDGSEWTDYYGDCVKKFPGNFDRDTVVTNKIEIPIIARHIRVIIHKWNEKPSLRMELYGCTLPA